MFLRDSNAIRTAIHNLISGHTTDEPIGLAVAFWGAGAEGMLSTGRRYRVICNLSMGGTNPQVIAQVMERSDVEVRHLPDLHAKVVVALNGAVVSSANFSANGLGLEGAPSGGWQEAGVFIPAEDGEFAQVYGWFALRWRAAMPVTPEVLELATRQWQLRKMEHEVVTASVVDTASITLDTIPELMESDLFLARLEPKHRIRMAAPWLVETYKIMQRSSLNPSDHFVPAYAANILWTLAGKTIRTNISTTPEFRRPGQVLERAADRGSDYAERSRNLIVHLSKLADAPQAVRYWAQRWVDTTS